MNARTVASARSAGPAAGDVGAKRDDSTAPIAQNTPDAAGSRNVLRSATPLPAPAVVRPSKESPDMGSEAQVSRPLSARESIITTFTPEGANWCHVRLDIGHKRDDNNPLVRRLTLTYSGLEARDFSGLRTYEQLYIALALRLNQLEINALAKGYNPNDIWGDGEFVSLGYAPF